MRITKYDTELQDDYRNVLVKEFSKNYPTEDKLNNPEMISHMMCEINLCSIMFMWCCPICFGTQSS